jgi:aminomethyltransferase
VFYEGQRSGEVRSGTMSPSLSVPIGTACLPIAGTKEGSRLEIDVRGKRVSATVVKMPFYKKGSHK